MNLKLILLSTLLFVFKWRTSANESDLDTEAYDDDNVFSENSENYWPATYAEDSSYSYMEDDKLEASNDVSETESSYPESDVEKENDPMFTAEIPVEILTFTPENSDYSKPAGSPEEINEEYSGSEQPTDTNSTEAETEIVLSNAPKKEDLMVASEDPDAELKQPSNKSADSEQPHTSAALLEEGEISVVDAKQTSNPSVDSEKSYTSAEPLEESDNSAVETEKPSHPSVDSEKSDSLAVEAEQPSNPSVDSEKPDSSAGEAEQSSHPSVDSETSYTSVAEAEQPSDSSVNSVDSEQPYIPVSSLEETNKLAVEPEKPPNPNVAAEQPYDSKVTSEALIASSEQPIIMLASESPVASEQTLSPELSAMHSSRAPEKLVDMIINSEPPLYSETSAAPKELNIYLDTSTGSKADLSPYELNLETVNTDGPNDISEKPVELSAASPNESANKELVVEEINNPNSVSESPAESLTSASNQPAVTTKKEKETLSPSFYSLTSTSTTTEKAIYLPSMTAEPPMVSVVNKEESVPILWNSDNIAVHSNLSNSSADSEAHISANALEYFTTTQSPSTYYLQESTDSISTSHSISPSDLYAKLPDNNSSSELELNNTKSELVNLINADYPGISTLANTTYSDESASTATAANVAYTTISTGIVASYVLRKLNQFY